jgi:hypothetical protein
MSQTRLAWMAFLLSSALIVGALFPIVNYGQFFLFYPITLLFGCDSARSAGDCLRIQLTPWVPPALAIAALITCRIAISQARYATSVAVAALACAASWVIILSWS